LADPLGDVHDLVHDFPRAREEVIAMELRDDKGMALRRLRDVQDGQDVIVFVDLGGGDLSFDDSAENVFHR
jgi:hypothetical protein